MDPPGTADLQFRDIEAFDADHAVALTIGEGEQSRLYVTGDGGRTWAETFRNDDPAAFYDCVTFLDRRHGLALSDPVGGRFRILTTSDGGRSWSVRPTTGMPGALPGEFAFAASGTCLVTADHGSAGRAWFATGGGERARVFATTNGGRTWQVTDSSIPGGPSAGVYSLAFRDPRHGIAVGGDYAVPAPRPTPPRPPVTAAGAGSPPARSRTNTVRARPGWMPARPWRSGPPAATSAATAAGPGPSSTAAVSTRCNAYGERAGRRENRVAWPR
ncbi:oxidoreductase [Couchioplanes caeruleus]|uniref:WD40/YVTN/BNR-like repeat-containing protein n=1 Tax=Couchioplanes caeruleus TaxID=56438 RepID=UPI0020BDF292|nr:oxidoreductase [Couchioplanes caeruleus]UQU66497.1 oxidoreductase [Couchioplanes caeruleus]